MQESGAESAKSRADLKLVGTETLPTSVVIMSNRRTDNKIHERVLD